MLSLEEEKIQSWKFDMFISRVFNKDFYFFILQLWNKSFFPYKDQNKIRIIHLNNENSSKHMEYIIFKASKWQFET